MTTRMRNIGWRTAAAALVLVVLAGCDDEVEVGGVGASAELPTAFTNGPTNTPDLGAGNVHWVGNPRW
jgi:hypothetical protein